MKKYKWNNPCPCAGGDWQRETRQSLYWPLKPWGLHRSFLRRHPSWRSPEEGWGPPRARQLSKSPFYLQPSSYHNSTHLASYLVSHRAVRGEKGSSAGLVLCKWQSTVVHFLQYTCDESLKRKQNPCGQKMAPSSVVKPKTSAESSCSVAPLPFPQAVNSGFSVLTLLCVWAMWTATTTKLNHANNFTNKHDFSF